MEDVTTARMARINDRISMMTTLTTLEMIKMTEDDLTTVDLHLPSIRRRLTLLMEDIMEDLLRWTRRRFESLESKDVLSDLDDPSRRNLILRRRIETTELLEILINQERTTEILTTQDLTTSQAATAQDVDNKMILMMIRMTVEMMTEDLTMEDLEDHQDLEMEVESKDLLPWIRRRHARFNPREEELLMLEKLLDPRDTLEHPMRILRTILEMTKATLARELTDTLINEFTTERMERTAEDNKTLMTRRCRALEMRITDDPTIDHPTIDHLLHLERESKDLLLCPRRRLERSLLREEEPLMLEKSLMSHMEPTTHRAESEAETTMTAQVETLEMIAQETSADVETTPVQEVESKALLRWTRRRLARSNRREDDHLESQATPAALDQAETRIINFLLSSNVLHM